MPYFGRPRSTLQFAQIPRGQRRSIPLDITDPAFDSAIQYAVDTNADGSFADSLREMILAAVSGDLASTAVKAAREQARLEASRLVRQAMGEALEHIARRLSALDGAGPDAVHGILRGGEDEGL